MDTVTDPIDQIDPFENPEIRREYETWLNSLETTDIDAMAAELAPDGSQREAA